ncbi:MAG: glycosyltransferase family 8 protein [Bacteroidaceae bacterium]|nr:glycosyltransferase family 8 protein [Bacteroidaceae bacterium]
MKTTMNIVCATDDNYVPLCGIMLTSLFENNKDCHIDTYIITSDLNKKNKSQLEALSTSKTGYDTTIHFCETSEQTFKNCPIRKGDHVSLAAYYRLLTPLILPTHVEKVLYLDCDIIITDSLYQLYNTDISDVSLAACAEHDGEIGKLQVSESHITRLGYPIKWGYFNSGVLLINLSYWRKNNISNTLIDYISNNKEKCLLHDQDALNAVLGGQKKFIPYKYNFMTYLFTPGYATYNKDVFLEERPAIIHYCTPTKPWDWYLYDYPFSKQREHYRTISPWKNWENNMPMKKKLIRKFLSWKNKLIKKELSVYDNSWKKWEP